MTVVTGMAARRQAILPLLCLAALAMSGMVACAVPSVRAGGVGPPASAIGRQGLLVIPVRFPDTSPSRTIREITAKVRRVAEYVSKASYGRASIDPRVLDWQAMPRPLAEYRVSPYNYRVDRARVSRLLEDALSAAALAARLDDFEHVYVVVGVHTEPGTGYGMIAYAANPGMLSGVRRARARHETIHLEAGQGPLILRIPLGAARYLLLENRQPVGLGKVLPASGLLVPEAGARLRLVVTTPDAAGRYRMMGPTATRRWRPSSGGCIP